ncbi:UNKNOWN [Stylonychia lemnae]|uniref:Uncharacterized protein n=1 Tax=Stylonychia lemnae TaxID=5949 RepID=A0A078AJ54_STYLE|nr:UNKNOWN [Stylonychia lemnae]|eukprot:CDW81507.1 UNKNOWN [Stylonychia lemnae]
MRAQLLFLSAVCTALVSAEWTGKILPELQRAIKGENKAQSQNLNQNGERNSPALVEETPKVKNFGIFSDVMINNIGFNLGLSMDYSIGYNLPLYNDNQYLVWEQTAKTLFGGRSYLTIGFFLFKITLFADVIGGKASVNFREKLDTIAFNEMCYSTDYLVETLKVVVTGNLDVNECSFGLLGILLPGVFADCQWKNYYVDYPLYTYNPLNKFWQGTLVPETCTNA